MKKIVFLMMMVVMVTTTITAQEVSTAYSGNATLLQPAGSYIYYGNQVMNKKQCAEFLSTRNQPAYEKFQSGLNCVKGGWWTFGAGLLADAVGGILWYYGEDKQNDAMSWSGLGFICAGGLAVIAAIPTIYIGYEKMNTAVDMFNVSTATAPRAHWSIQGSQNGIGLALHF